MSKNASNTTPLRPRLFGPSRNLLDYLLVLPTLLVVLGVTLYPTLDGVRIAFTDAWLLQPGAERFVGIENFTRLFSDDSFWEALGHSLTVTAVALQFVLGLILAHFLAGDGHLGVADYRHRRDLRVRGDR